MQKASPFQPLYSLKLDAIASALVALTAAAYIIPCDSDRCLFLMSRLNDLIPINRYYLAVIDQGGTLKDALECNALVFSGFVIAFCLFFAGLIFEIRRRETRVAGDDRLWWLLITGFILIWTIIYFNLFENHKFSPAKSILLTCQSAMAVAGCLQRALIQVLARVWDKPSEGHS